MPSIFIEIKSVPVIVYYMCESPHAIYSKFIKRREMIHIYLLFVLFAKIIFFTDIFLTHKHA